MEIFKYITALYIFFAFIFLGIATSVVLLFPSATRYIYAAALFLHAVLILFFFIHDAIYKEKEQ